MFTMFVCSDIEEGWYRYLAEQSEREILAYERDEDLDVEMRLGHLAILEAEEDSCDPDEYLPSYASRPYEICYPEVFEP